MNDLISRKAAIKAIRKDMYADKDFMSAMICEGIECMLNSVPSAEPERKTGRWIDKDGGLATCSVCGDRWGVWSVMNFCPNCGARMEVKDE